MLALTRKKGETIVIGEDIEVVVLGVSGEQVKLGVVAPREIPVHRKEIYDQIKLANKEALQNTEISGLKEILK